MMRDAVWLDRCRTLCQRLLVYKWAGHSGREFLQPLRDSTPAFRSLNLLAWLPFFSRSFYTSRPFSSKIMFSRVIVSSVLLAALANGLVFKRE